jgi:hypothetical protein
MRGGVQSLGGLPFTITGNRTWTGFQTFQGTVGQSNPTAEFRAAASQTGNLLEFYNSGGSRVAYFDAAGNFTSVGAVSYASTLVTQSSPSAVGFQVKGAASATADLQQWENSTGAVLMGITAAGSLYGASGLSVSGNITATGSLSGASAAITGGITAASESISAAANQNAFTITDSGTTGANLKLIGTNGSPAAPNKYLRSVGGQFQIVNSAFTTPIFTLDDIGNVTLVGGGSTERSGSAALMLKRGAMSTTATGIRFNSGSGGSIDQAIMLAPNSEDVIFGTDNGSTFTETLRIRSNTNGGILIPSTVAAPPSGTALGGGLRLSIYGTPTTDATTFGFGIDTSTLWYESSTSHRFYAGTTALLEISNQSAAPASGVPWMRNTGGGSLVINPNGTGQLYLCLDKPNQLNVGGAMAVTGATTLSSTLGVTGTATFSGTVALNGAVNTGTSPVTIGTGGLHNTGATQLDGAVGITGLLSIQGITTNSTVTHNTVGRMVFSGATTFGSGTTASGISLGVVVNGVNYWISLNT